MNQKEKLSRRQMLAMSLGLGAFGLSSSEFLFAQAADLRVTPEQIMGPFYPILRPLDHDADLTLVKGRPGRAKGEIVELVGRVLNKNGQPVRGATIELWQANTHGRYDHPTDSNVAPLDPNFQGYGRQMTDSQGRYRFKTVKPGAYPVSPTEIRPPHIHLDVYGKKDRLVTQMYFPGEPLNEKDSFFNALGIDKATATGKIHEGGSSTGKLITFDIILDKG